MIWPSKKQWGQFFRILSRKEKIIFLLFFFSFIISSVSLVIGLYFKTTEIRPTKGGIFREGILSQPTFINPIYATANDTDRDLVELIFSGLMKYDSNKGIIPDLAKEVKIEDEGKIYNISLKDNVFWSDGLPLTAEDVIFTIDTIQNPDVKSPLRGSWLGVEVEKISDKEISFKLKNPYAAFLENLTLKILPKHIWQDVQASNFVLSSLNLKPVGSGPYKIESLEKNSAGGIIYLTLKPNQKYYGNIPFIQEINFKVFGKEKDVVEAAKRKEIDGFSLSAPAEYDFLETLGFKKYTLTLPRYFAIFLNPGQSKALAEKEVRQALNLATDKTEILNKIILNQGNVVDSPILPEIYGFSAPSKIYQFNLDEAKAILEKDGFVLNENGIMEKIIKKELAFQFKSNLKLESQGIEVTQLQKCLAKDTDIYPNGETTGYFGQKTKEAVIKFQEKYREEILTPSGLSAGTGEVLKSTINQLNKICFENPEEKISLQFSLITANQPILTEVANLLKEQWKKLGAEVTVETLEVSPLQTDVIQKRDYSAVLFGEISGLIIDPLPFWHSSQKKDPGLNLAEFENKECDKLLEDARQSLNDSERKEKLENFQNILIEQAPAVFLYNPNYIYFVDNKIKGLNVKIITDPSKRFEEVENWYINTKRALK